MTEPGCSLAALLREGGPVRVTVRPCCLLALVGRRPPYAPTPDGTPLLDSTVPDCTPSFACEAATGLVGQDYEVVAETGMVR